jgi:DNA topoisomerase IA
LSRIDGEKVQIPNSERAEQIRSELQAATHKVTSVETKGRLRKPYPPLTTSKSILTTVRHDIATRRNK